MSNRSIRLLLQTRKLYVKNWHKRRECRKDIFFVRVNVAHIGKNLISNRRMVRICLGWLEGALELVLKQMILSYAVWFICFIATLSIYIRHQGTAALLSTFTALIILFIYSLFLPN